jgi:hypothetical protein
LTEQGDIGTRDRAEAHKNTGLSPENNSLKFET